MCPDEKIIDRIAGMIASCPIGIEPIQYVRDKLAGEGMSDYSIFLAYKAAELLNKSRESLF